MRVSRIRFHISHTRFAIAFPTSLYVVCNALNIDRLSKWFPRGDGLDLQALAAFLFAGLCLTIAVFTLVAHRLTIKPFAVQRGHNFRGDDGVHADAAGRQFGGPLARQAEDRPLGGDIAGSPPLPGDRGF